MLASNFIPPDVNVCLQSENGILGLVSHSLKKNFFNSQKLITLNGANVKYN